MLDQAIPLKKWEQKRSLSDRLVSYRGSKGIDKKIEGFIRRLRITKGTEREGKIESAHFTLYNIRWIELH